MAFKGLLLMTLNRITRYANSGSWQGEPRVLGSRRSRPLRCYTAVDHRHFEVSLAGLRLDSTSATLQRIAEAKTL